MALGGSPMILKNHRQDADTILASLTDQLACWQPALSWKNVRA